MLYKCSLLLLAFVGLSSASSLSEVCNNKWKTIKIDSFTEARALIEQMDNSTCSDKQLQALHDLDRLIDPLDQVEICSLEMVERIERFHSNYVNSESVVRKYLPKPFRKFFIAFAMKLHQHCVKILVEKLPEDNNLLKYDDRSMIKHHLKNDSMLLYALKAPKNYDDLALLTATIDPESDVWKERRVIRGEMHVNIYMLYSSCKKAFKPIYDRRIMPVYRLSRLGYNYVSKDLEKEIGPIGEKPDIVQWYRMTLLCDSLLFYELWHDQFRKKHEVVPDEPESFREPMNEINPHKQLVVVSDDGEKYLQDSLFEKEPQGGELKKAMTKFSSKRDNLKLARKEFVSHLNKDVRGIVLKTLLKDKLFHRGSDKKRINFTKLVAEIKEKMKSESKGSKTSVSKTYGFFSTTLMRPLDWIMVLVTFLFTRFGKGESNIETPSEDDFYLYI